MDLGTLWVKIAGDAKALQTTLSSTKTQLKGFSANVAGFAKQNEEQLRNVGIAFTAIGGAITAGMGFSVKVFADFEQGMKNVQAVSRGTQNDLARLTAKAEEVGVATALSARQAADAFYSLASAGLQVEEQIAAIDAVTTLALATQSDLAGTSELVVKSLKGFSLAASESGRVADVMANAIANSLANLGRLQTAMPYVAASFNSFGYSVEDAAGALSVLMNAGLEASQAGTGLRRALNDLVKPTDQAAAALKSMGIELEEVNPASHTLVEIIDRLDDVGLTAANAVTIFGERSETMKILVKEGADELENMIGKMMATGTAQAMMEEQMDSLAGSLTMMKSSLEAVAINIGEKFAPSVRLLAKEITELLNWFNRMPEILQSILTVVTGVTGALTLLGGAGLILVSQLPKIIAGFKALDGLLKTTRVSAKGLTMSLLAVTAAISAIIIAYNRYKKTQKEMRTEEFALAEGHKEQVRLTNHLREAVKGLTDAQKEGWERAEINAKYLKNVSVPTYVQAEQGLVNVGKAVAFYSKLLAENEGQLQRHFDEQLKNNKATEEAEEENVKLARTYEQVRAEFDAWVSITGEGYRATTQDRIDYVDSLLKSTDLEKSAIAGLTNLRLDMLKQLTDEQKKVRDKEMKMVADRQRELDREIDTQARLLETTSMSYRSRQAALRELMEAEGLSVDQQERLQALRLKWFTDNQKHRDAEIAKEQEKAAKEEKARQATIKQIDKELDTELKATAKANEAGEKLFEDDQERRRKRAEELEAALLKEANVTADSQAAITKAQEEASDDRQKILDKYFDKREMSRDEEKEDLKDFYTTLYQMALKNGDDADKIMRDYWNARDELNRAHYIQEVEDVLDHYDNIVTATVDGLNFIRKELLGFEDSWGAQFVDTLAKGIEIAANTKLAMEDMGASLEKVGAAITQTGGGASVFGGTISSLGGTLSGIAPQVGIAVGAFQTLFAVGEMLNNTFGKTKKVIQDALQKSLGEINERFRDEFRLTEKYGGDILALEEEWRREQIKIIQSYNIDVLELDEFQKEALTRNLRSYIGNVENLQRQAALDEAEANRDKNEKERSTFSTMYASLVEQYDRRAALVKQSGADVAKLEEEKNAAILELLKQWNIELFDELGAGYDRAREIAQQYGIDVAEIERAQQEERRRIKEEYASDWEIERSRIDIAKEGLAEELSAVQQHWQDRIALIRSAGLDYVKAEQEMGVILSQTVEAWFDKNKDLRGTSYTEILALAEEYGVTMEVWQANHNAKLLELQEQYAYDTGIITRDALGEELENMKMHFETLMSTLSNYNIDTTSAHQEQYEALKALFIENGIDVLNMTSAQEHEVIMILQNAGFTRYELERMQNEALQLLQEEYSRETITQIDKQLEAELKLQKEHNDHLNEIITASSGKMLDLLAQTELDRINAKKASRIEDIEKERAQRLLRIEQDFAARSKSDSIAAEGTRNQQLAMLNEDYNVAIADANDSAYTDRLNSLDRVNVEIIEMERQRALQIAEILQQSAQEEVDINRVVANSLYAMEDAYGHVEQSILSVDRATRQLIATNTQLLDAVNAAEDVLVGHSLSTAYDTVAESIDNATRMQENFNRMTYDVWSPETGMPTMPNAAAPNRIEPPSPSSAPGGSDRPTVIHIDNYYGSEAEKQQLSDTITRLQRKRGTI